MEVVPIDGGFGLLEADVIEAGKRGSVDVGDGVIRDQKMLFPSHENEIWLFQLIVVEMITVEGLGEGVEGVEPTLKIKDELSL